MKKISIILLILFFSTTKPMNNEAKIRRAKQKIEFAHRVCTWGCENFKPSRPSCQGTCDRRYREQMEALQKEIEDQNKR